MYFTQEDFRQIERWLQHRAVKDTQLPPALPVDGTEKITVVQDGENKQLPLYCLLAKIKDTTISGVYNVTDRNNKTNITLNEAIYSVPVSQRIAGLIVTFIREDGAWDVVQFTGKSINQWGTLNLWKGLFDGIIGNKIYYPDSEDIESIEDDRNRKLLKFADRHHNKSEFSGKGYKILRKNLRGFESCTEEEVDGYNVLTQSALNEENTIYVVRYDFTIKSGIIMPKGCELLFEGGTISGGFIDLNGCKLVGMVGPESDYIINCEVSNWAVGQIEYRDSKLLYWNGENWVS